VITNTVDTYWLEIHIAGDVAEAKFTCREFCYAVGLCVTVQSQTFIYTGGEEEGVVVTIRNYPRFPSTPVTLRETAQKLAELLRQRLFQHTYLIVGSDKTEWSSRRDENPAAK
jgi:hypothetical protein